MSECMALSGQVKAVRVLRSRCWMRVVCTLLAIAAAAWWLTLLLGQSYTPPAVVWQVLNGEPVPGASFTVGQLRLPRALISLLVGMSFGMAGVAFQTMLRNPLASPDIVAIRRLYPKKDMAHLPFLFFFKFSLVLSIICALLFWAHLYLRQLSRVGIRDELKFILG